MRMSLTSRPDFCDTDEGQESAAPVSLLKSLAMLIHRKLAPSVSWSYNLQFKTSQVVVSYDASESLTQGGRKHGHSLSFWEENLPSLVHFFPFFYNTFLCSCLALVVCLLLFQYIWRYTRTKGTFFSFEDATQAASSLLPSKRTRLGLLGVQLNHKPSFFLQELHVLSLLLSLCFEKNRASKDLTLLDEEATELSSQKEDEGQWGNERPS